ncbi:MAG TPA: TrmH family RNA methyltransferase [Chitinophagales bacterium]|nr:TrmH family RNA methyltransferase [Chitinophagales bacterium]
MRKLKLDELNRLSTADFKQAEKTPIIVVLDNIRSAANVGSVFRTCDAFLVKAIYLVGICATPPNREIQKAALGATETVDWVYFESIEHCISHLKLDKYSIMAVEQSDASIYLHEFIPDKEQNFALVFGNEVEVVSEYVMQQCDACIEIPQFGMKHSLNIAVAAGIILWDFAQKLRL